VVLRQPLHRRGRKQQGLLRVPGTEGFGLAHDPFSRPDRLLSLGSGQIGGRLWRSGRRGYVRHAPSTGICSEKSSWRRCLPPACRPPAKRRSGTGPVSV
jgi:hypothetical protein